MPVFRQELFPAKPARQRRRTMRSILFPHPLSEPVNRYYV
jgi:hypothetical protein